MIAILLSGAVGSVKSLFPALNRRQSLCSVKIDIYSMCLKSRYLIDVIVALTSVPRNRRFPGAKGSQEIFSTGNFLPGCIFSGNFLLGDISYTEKRAP